MRFIANMSVSRFGSRSSSRSASPEPDIDSTEKAKKEEEEKAKVRAIITDYLSSAFYLKGDKDIVDVGLRRVTNVKHAVEDRDALALGDLPFKTNKQTKVIDFNQYTLSNSAEPKYASDLVTLGYLKIHYEPKKRTR